MGIHYPLLVAEGLPGTAPITMLTDHELITGVVYDDDWNLHDVSSYVPAAADGVIIRTVNELAGATSYSNVGVLSGTIDGGSLVAAKAASMFIVNGTGGGANTTRFHEHWAQMDGDGKIFLKASSSNVKFYVAGWFDDQWNIQTTLPEIGELDTLDYEPLDISSLITDDGNVEAALIQLDGGLVDGGLHGGKIRRTGSTFEPDGFSSVLQSNHLLVKIDDDDTFEGFAAGAEVKAFLVGYRLRGMRLTMLDEPEDLAQVNDDNWNAEQASGFSSLARTAILQVYSDESSLKFLDARKIGSSNTARESETHYMQLHVGCSGENFEVRSEDTAKAYAVGYTI